MTPNQTWWIINKIPLIRKYWRNLSMAVIKVAESRFWTCRHHSRQRPTDPFREQPLQLMGLWNHRIQLHWWWHPVDRKHHRAWRRLVVRKQRPGRGIRHLGPQCSIPALSRRTSWAGICEQRERWRQLWWQPAANNRNKLNGLGHARARLHPDTINLLKLELLKCCINYSYYYYKSKKLKISNLTL